jgi:hypothetical protein
MAYADGETRGYSFATIPPVNLEQSTCFLAEFCSGKNNNGLDF